MPKYLPLLLTVCFCLFLAGCRQSESLSPSSPPETTLPESTAPQPSESQAPDASVPDTIDPLAEAARLSANEALDGTAAGEPEDADALEISPSSAPDDTAAARTAIASDEPLSPQTDTALPVSEDISNDQAHSAPQAERVITPRSQDTAGIEGALLALINDARIERGLTALGIEESMQFAAGMRAQEALASLSHSRPDGTPYHTAFDEAGFPYAGKWHGENLAVIQLLSQNADDIAIAQALFDEWKQSPGHQQNMFNENFLQTGIGVAVETDGDTTRVGSAQLFASL